MIDPLSRFHNATSDPALLGQLRELFDEVWASLTAQGNFGKPDSTDAQRDRLAEIIFKLANNGAMSALEITSTASRLMREGEFAA